MKYPSDFTEEMRNQGICGVLAIAVAANVTMAEAHKACANNLLPHQKKHVRRTYDEQLQAALLELGFRVTQYDIEKQNVRKWLSGNSDETCMLFVSGHVLSVSNGMILDQQAHLHFEAHPARRRFVQKIWIVEAI